MIPKEPYNQVCEVPKGGFKSWKQGVVTLIQPTINKSCPKIISGDKDETNRVKQAKLKLPKDNFSIDALIRKTSNCTWLAEYLSDNLYNTELEKSFPIAFSFIVYDNPRQFLRLFKFLYKPQNIHCIHPDKKTKPHFYTFFKNIASCFTNVIIAKNRIDVYWGHPSLMEAQMSCFSDLLDYRARQEWNKWRYVINLCGKELPIISTKEMVKKLIYMNGTSSIVGWVIPKSEWWTWRRLRGKPLPYNLTFYKSMTYNALSEPFVRFLMKSSVAQKVYTFFKDTDFPEEHFYPTLFRMPGIPGGYNPAIPDDKYFEVGHYFWRTNQAEVALPCFGETVHGICVVNYGDLPRVMQETKNGETALFQNKYFMEKDYVAMDCMEERIVDMNRKEFKQDCPTEAKQFHFL